MFVGRRPDSTIYGIWTSRQPDDACHTGMEELDDEHSDVVAFIQRPPSIDSLQERWQAIDSIKARLEILEFKIVKNMVFGAIPEVAP